MVNMTILCRWHVIAAFLGCLVTEAKSNIRELQDQPKTDFASEVAAAQQLHHEVQACSNLFSMAKAESLNFFNDITNGAWQKMKRRVGLLPNHGLGDPMEQAVIRPHVWYQFNWEPNFTCPNERKVGGIGDGSKYVCDIERIAEVSRYLASKSEKKDGCLIYSFGSSGNFNFEIDASSSIGDGECEIHIFDPTDYRASTPPHMHFHHWGLASSNDKNRPLSFKSMQEIVKELGHEGRVMDIFKIDCEGCEWDTFNDWFDTDIDIRQILVETHLVPENANEFFGRIHDERFVMFHKEPNIWASQGSCQEFAFLKLDRAFFS